MSEKAHPNIDTEPYADDTPLTKLFGTHAKVKLLAVFASERNRDLNVADLAQMAGIARSTAYEHLDELLELEVIEETRTVGNSSMFQLNEDSAIAERVYELEGLILKRELQNQGQIESTAD